MAPIAEKRAKGAWCREWRLISLDGGTPDTADTEENEKAFRRAGTVAAPANFPRSALRRCWETALAGCGPFARARMPPTRSLRLMRLCRPSARACSAWRTASFRATIAGKERPRRGRTYFFRPLQPTQGHSGACDRISQSECAAQAGHPGDDSAERVSGAQTVRARDDDPQRQCSPGVAGDEACAERRRDPAGLSERRSAGVREMVARAPGQHLQRTARRSVDSGHGWHGEAALQQPGTGRARGQSDEDGAAVACVPDLHHCLNPDGVGGGSAGGQPDGFAVRAARAVGVAWRNGRASNGRSWCGATCVGERNE